MVVLRYNFNPFLSGGTKYLFNINNNNNYDDDGDGGDDDDDDHMTIAQNAYCSQDIYFQFKKACRSVISRVIMQRRLERPSLIGCHERRTMLISMM